MLSLAPASQALASSRVLAQAVFGEPGQISTRPLIQTVDRGFLIRVQVEVSLGCSVPPTSAGPGSHVTFKGAIPSQGWRQEERHDQMGPSGAGIHGNTTSD